MDKKRSVVSLFSGAGGFDWGFHRADFETRLACEKEDHPAATLAHNLKLTTIEPSEIRAANTQPAVIFGDICDVDFAHLDFEPDVVIGGPPCQDFSMAQGGERKGLDGDRGMLYLQFVRAMIFLQPKIFVFENVLGIKSANNKQAYQKILTHLQHLDTPEDYPEIGEMLSNYNAPKEDIHGYYLFFEDTINATHLGIAQTRERVIVIGVRRDIYRASPLNWEKIKGELRRKIQGQDKLFNKYPMTCLEIFEGRPLNELQDKYVEVMRAYESLAFDEQVPQARNWQEQVWCRLTWDIVQDYFIANEIQTGSFFQQDEFDQAMEEHRELLVNLGWLNKPLRGNVFLDKSNDPLRQSDEVARRMFMIPPDENHEFVKHTKWHVEGKDISFIYRRAAPLKPAWTVMAYGGGGTYGYHYERSRAMLTLRERARIQTFTDDFEFKGYEVRAQIGEAVPPLMGEIIAKEILNLLKLIDSVH